MRDNSISNDIIYIGTDDKDIELFENQYDVPNGISYNSYIIIDKKIAIMDTIDKRKILYLRHRYIVPKVLQSRKLSR